LLADAWFDVCLAPAGSPLDWAIVDMFIEVAEALACLALAVAVWRDRPSEVPSAGSRGAGLGAQR
jgi:hypothetical protein